MRVEIRPIQIQVHHDFERTVLTIEAHIDSNALMVVKSILSSIGPVYLQAGEHSVVAESNAEPQEEHRFKPAW